jgi:DNA-binding transcriptional LysR family regulator
MLGKGITLRALELFEVLAETGSVQRAAELSGLSLPAVSQQLTNLESACGAPLIDRSRRPMPLTPAGRLFLRRVREALRQLRQAQAELTVLNLAEITPHLVISLAQNLTNCEFRLTTAPSHQVMQLLADRQLDLVICATPQPIPPGLAEHPLLRDPYVLAVPCGFSLPQGAELAALADLPLLRYDPDQLMGRQIEAHLARLRLTLPGRFELDSNQSILGLVASGAGWSITTPLAYLRAQQFVGQVDIHPLPFAAFSRNISLLAQSDQIGSVAQDIARSLRVILQTRVVDRAQTLIPWLGASFSVQT